MTSKSNVSEHIKHIFEDGELDKTVVVRNFRITTQHGAMEGKTQSRDVAHYNLDMIIALGYRVQSQVATRFRLRYISNSFSALAMACWCETLREMDLLESDFDREIKKLKEK